MKIGLLDSGIGGLTVLKTLILKCPNHEYIYYGDTLHIPYGNKNEGKLINYANNIIKFLESKKVDIIIIACGTLSSLIDKLTSNVLLIDILSPIKGMLDKYNNISIIATPLSIKKNIYAKYIKSNLNLIACPNLVPIIESNNYNLLDDTLKEYLKSTTKSDALLLGCTHYPIIKNYIRKYFKKDIICLDDYLPNKLQNLDECPFKLTLYFSKLDDIIINNVYKILNKDNLEIERRVLNDRK